MSLTRAGPYAETNRLKDVIQKLEQGRPIALRLAGRSTAAQALFPDDPHSTWGFETLGYPHKHTGMGHRFNEILTLFVTLFSWCDGLDVPGNLAKNSDRKVVWPSECDNVKEGFSRVSSHDPNAGETSHIIKLAVTTDAALTHQASGVPVKVEQEKPVVEVTTPDFLEPAIFTWTRSDFKAREAARIFSEGVYADH